MTQWNREMGQSDEDELWAWRLEGEKGERLAVALLAELLRDPQYLWGFMELVALELGDKAPQALRDKPEKSPVLRLEHAFTKDKERRRIDLVIETDALLIGVEAKVYASLAEHQVQDYSAWLSERSSTSKKEVMFLVLCREAAAATIKQQTGPRSITTAELSWEAIWKIVPACAHSLWIWHGFTRFMRKFLGHDRKAAIAKVLKGDRGLLADAIAALRETIAPRFDVSSATGGHYKGVYLRYPESANSTISARGFVGFVNGSEERWRDIAPSGEWRLVYALPAEWKDEVRCLREAKVHEVIQRKKDCGVAAYAWGPDEEVVFRVEPSQVEQVLTCLT